MSCDLSLKWVWSVRVERKRVLDHVYTYNIYYRVYTCFMILRHQSSVDKDQTLSMNWYTVGLDSFITFISKSSQLVKVGSSISSISLDLSIYLLSIYPIFHSLGPFSLTLPLTSKTYLAFDTKTLLSSARQCYRDYARYHGSRRWGVYRLHSSFCSTGQ